MKKETYKPTGKEFEIKTIKKLFAVITKENLPYIMADLYKTADLMLAMDEVSKIAHEGAGIKYKKIELPIWRWIDDGLNDLGGVTISDKKGNKFDIGEALINEPNF